MRMELRGRHDGACMVKEQCAQSGRTWMMPLGCCVKRDPFTVSTVLGAAAAQGVGSQVQSIDCFFQSSEMVDCHRHHKIHLASPQCLCHTCAETAKSTMGMMSAQHKALPTIVPQYEPHRVPGPPPVAGGSSLFKSGPYDCGCPAGRSTDSRPFKPS